MENRLQSRSVGLFVHSFGLILIAAIPLAAQAPGQSASPKLSFGGLIAATAQARFDVFEPFFSLRAMPKLDVSLPAGRGWSFDGEASANASITLIKQPGEDARLTSHLKPYRVWTRLSSARFEARLGLQQLSFGSATLFRPLMWFDSLDPRDPLQLTDGVYGLLLRFYAKGNANAWLWGLYGNTGRRGFDLAPPDEKNPEFGGRVEIPLFKGEIAATYHHRKANIDGLSPIMSPLASRAPFAGSLLCGSSIFPPPVIQATSIRLAQAPASPGSLSHFASPAALALGTHASSALSPSPLLPGASPIAIAPVPEDRFGLDGKWDLGVGVWFEGALVHQRTPFLPLSYQRAWTLGADYTFALGRGLTAVAEHFRIDSAARAFAPGDGLSFTALLLRYPLGILDELSGIVYYDWKDRGWYRFIGWTRKTDAITFSAIVFWNPAQLAVFRGLAGSGSFAGTGLELILAYNF